MPFTCGRTSATRKAATRPGNSVVIGTGVAFSVTTETFGGGGAGGGAGEQANSAATIVRHESRRSPIGFDMVTSLCPTGIARRAAGRWDIWMAVGTFKLSRGPAKGPAEVAGFPAI